MEEALEFLGLDQAVEDALSPIAIEIGRGFSGLDLGLEPAALRGFLNVQILDPDLAAIGGLQAVEQFLDAHAGAVEEVPRPVDLVQIRFRKAEPLEAQARIGRDFLEEGIHIRLGVPDGTKGVDRSGETGLLDGRIFAVTSRGGGDGSVAGSVVSEVEAFEEGLPFRIQGIGGFPPLGVLFVDQIGVPSVGEAGMFHESYIVVNQNSPNLRISNDLTIRCADRGRVINDSNSQQACHKES